jgi:hypothetical protein
LNIFANFGILFPFMRFAFEVTVSADGAAFPERGAVKAVVATSAAESAATEACTRQLATENRDFLAGLALKVGRVSAGASATSAETGAVEAAGKKSLKPDEQATPSS